LTGAGSLVFGLASLGTAAAGAAPEIVALTAALAGLYTIYKAAKGEDASWWGYDLLNKASLSASGKDLPDKIKAIHDWFKGPTRGVRNNNPGNLKFAGQAGAQEVDGFAAWSTPEQGLYALGRQLELYSKRGLNTIASIIGEYDKGEPLKIPAYISDVAQRMGVNANARLNMQDPQILSRMMSYIIGHENEFDPYPSSMVSSAASKAIIVNNNQKIDIHVDGSGDPNAVAYRVKTALGRELHGLTRTAVPVVR